MVMPRHARIVTALGLTLACAPLAHPGTTLAQGTAPTQGVTQPQPQPAPPGGPPVPPATVAKDGQPRQDPGGGGASTAPHTTANTPLPPPGQADPPAQR
ncbi:hypothetical protein [Paracraurococcus ruber]|uniref:Uncharacterized protein n=1 Tax=Paracraurococcus ruber TaxID=77675 RepID=A0ABS1D1U6_9PROT|nr:hypothetical protein [Paracraurococcus ruber]MBK1660590.1 hypothetical protein [Paracraurococcus ruber]TDG27444.1 hypothetical protein E2C05_22905 [Paracraurococcus ruber]